MLLCVSPRGMLGNWVPNDSIVRKTSLSLASAIGLSRHWKNGYQMDEAFITKIQLTDREEYMARRNDFVTMEEDGTPCKKNSRDKNKIASKKKMYHG